MEDKNDSFISWVLVAIVVIIVVIQTIIAEFFR